MKTQFIKSYSIKTMLYIVTVLVLYSCGKSDKTNKGELGNTQVGFVPTKLIQQADKVIEIDDETTYNRITPKLYTDGKSWYYTFYNNKNRQLYFSDFQSGKIIQKVELFKEGPNMIRGRSIDYFIHTKDSIFINTEFSEKYLINANGEIFGQAKIEMEEKDGITYTNDRWEIDDPTVYKDGILHTGRRVLAPLIGASNPLRAELDFTKSTFEPTFLEEKTIVPGYDKYIPELLEMAKIRVISNMSKFVVGQPAHLFASSQISDSIYEYQNGKFIDAYYAGNPAVKTANIQEFRDMTIVKNDGKSRGISPNPDRTPNYSDMFMDTNKKWIYRILINRTHAEKMPDFDFYNIFTDAASLIIFDVENKKSYVMDLPMDKVFISYYGNRIFAMDQQLYIPTADQEIESEKRYNVFKLEE